MARCAAAFLRSPVLICAGLVQLHQRHVDAVATALLRDGHLDAMGIRRILGRRTMSARSVIFIALCALEDGRTETLPRWDTASQNVNLMKLGPNPWGWGQNEGVGLGPDMHSNPRTNSAIAVLRDIVLEALVYCRDVASGRRRLWPVMSVKCHSIKSGSRSCLRLSGSKPSRHWVSLLLGHAKDSEWATGRLGTLPIHRVCVRLAASVRANQLH